MGTQRYIDMTFDLSYPIEQPKFLQRLGETIPTDIVVQVKNKGVNYNLAGVTLGFEMRNDRDKILIDKDQSRFTIVSAAQGIFSYRPPEQMQSFFGNSYLAYFTFESGGTRITTERFRFYNDEDVQLAIAPELQEHYVSVIDDLITSNDGAMAKAEEIKALIQNNQVVKKAGDTMTGNLLMTGASAISQRFKAGTGAQVGWESLTDGTFRMYDWTNSRNVLSYNPATDYVSLNRKHPYVTKTGDTMTGDLNIVDNKGVSFMDATDPNKRKAYLSSGGNVTSLYDSLSSGRIWWYDHSTQTFTVDKNTNLMKKTGDSMTGNLDLSYSGTGTRKISFSQDGVEQVNINRTGAGYYGMYDVAGSQSVWEYNQATKTFNVNTPNTNLMKKTDYSGKDGTAILTLENGATAVGSRETFAIRSGNTVTLQLNAKRTNATDSQICMLPTNMRPPKMLVEYKNAVTGGVCQVVVNTNGAIQFHNNNLEVSGVITYTVN